MPTCDIAIIIVCAGRHGTTERRAGAPGMNTKYEKYVIDLYQHGFGISLLEELNQFHESIAGVMKVHSVTRYQLYMYIGALYNTAIVWLLSEEQEPVEEIATMFFQNYFTDDVK